jgi:DNA-binding transcriptional ArsR family regulator
MSDINEIVADEARAEALSEILKTVAHPIRLRVVALLCQEQHNVGEIARTLGIRQSLVSQHLSLLRLHGLVSSEKNGTTAVYSLSEKRLKKLLACLVECRKH